MARMPGFILRIFLLLACASSPCFADVIDEIVSNASIREGDYLECVIRIEEPFGEGKLFHLGRGRVKNGTVYFASLGTFSVSGITVRELRKVIYGKLAPPRGKIRSVGVRVRPKNSTQSISVGGLVNFEGRIPWEEGMTVGSALANSGALRASAYFRKIIFIRKSTLRTLNLNERADRDLRIEPDDVIMVQ